MVNIRLSKSSWLETSILSILFFIRFLVPSARVNSAVILSLSLPPFENLDSISPAPSVEIKIPRIAIPTTISIPAITVTVPYSGNCHDSPPKSLSNIGYLCIWMTRLYKIFCDAYDLTLFWSEYLSFIRLDLTKNKNSRRWIQDMTSSAESNLQTPNSGDLLSSQSVQ
jgi:hypothetical protein